MFVMAHGGVRGWAGWWLEGERWRGEGNGKNSSPLNGPGQDRNGHLSGVSTLGHRNGETLVKINTGWSGFSIMGRLKTKNLPTQYKGVRGKRWTFFLCLYCAEPFSRSRWYRMDTDGNYLSNLWYDPKFHKCFIRCPRPVQRLSSMS